MRSHFVVIATLIYDISVLLSGWTFDWWCRTCARDSGGYMLRGDTQAALDYEQGRHVAEFANPKGTLDNSWLGAERNSLTQ